MLIGTQLFIAGFLGEIILKTKSNGERYKIKDKILNCKFGLKNTSQI
jgi:glycosyltransferase, group 2 family